MRLARSRGNKSMQTIVRTRSSEYDIARPDQPSTGRFGESADVTTDHYNVSMWLFAPQEINIDTEYGDRLGGDLNGLALPDADIEVDDRVQHGTDEYEVQQIYHIPDNNNPTLKQFSLTRRTNE